MNGKNCMCVSNSATQSLSKGRRLGEIDRSIHDESINQSIEWNWRGILTQKYSFFMPGIRRCSLPTWCRQSRNTLELSRELMASSSVFMTRPACSASSFDSRWDSFVLSSWNFLNRPSMSSFSSNNLNSVKKDKENEQRGAKLDWVRLKIWWWKKGSKKCEQCLTHT